MAAEDVGSIFDSTEDVFELVVAWEPGESRPVVIHYLSIDGEYVKRNHVKTDSFSTAKIPQKFNGKTVKLAWAVAPSVDLRKAAIGLKRRGTPGIRKLVKQTDPKKLKRGKVWEGKDEEFSVEATSGGNQ